MLSSTKRRHAVGGDEIDGYARPKIELNTITINMHQKIDFVVHYSISLFDNTQITYDYSTIQYKTMTHCRGIKIEECACTKI